MNSIFSADRYRRGVRIELVPSQGGASLEKPHPSDSHHAALSGQHVLRGNDGSLRLGSHLPNYHRLQCSRSHWRIRPIFDVILAPTRSISGIKCLF